MALIKAQGKITWTASTAPDVIGYVIYQAADGGDPTYTSPFIEVGPNTLEASLPVEGLPGGEGQFKFAVAAKDRVGNLSDLRPLADAVLIDTTAPDAPATVSFTRDF